MPIKVSDILSGKVNATEATEETIREARKLRGFGKKEPEVTKPPEWYDRMNKLRREAEEGKWKKF